MTRNNAPNTRSKKTSTKKPTSKPSTAKKSTAVKTPVVKKTPKPAAKNKTTANLSIAQQVVNAIDNLKGKNTVCLDVRKLTDITDTIIITSGTSNRHVKSLADNAMLALKKSGHPAYGAEGVDAGEWVLVDFGDVVLHVMQPHVREFYDLEKLWSTPVAPPLAPNKKLASNKSTDRREE